MIRNHLKLGQGLTLEGWCLYLACLTGTSHWDKYNLSHRQIGTNCACPTETNTACPNWDWERSKKTSPCPTGQVICTRWRPFLVPGQALYPQWSLSQFHLSQLVPQSGSTRPWTFPNLCDMSPRFNARTLLPSPKGGSFPFSFFFLFTVGASWSVLISKGSCPFSSFFLGTVGWTRSRLGCEFLFFGVHSWTRGKLGCFDCQSPTAARPTVPKRKMRMGTTLPWAKGRTAKCHKCHKSATSSRLFSDVPQISMFRSYVLLSFGSDKSIILILATYTFMG